MIKYYSNILPLIIRFPKIWYILFIFSILISAAKFGLNRVELCTPQGSGWFMPRVISLYYARVG